MTQYVGLDVSMKETRFEYFAMCDGYQCAGAPVGGGCGRGTAAGCPVASECRIFGTFFCGEARTAVWVSEDIFWLIVCSDA